VNNISDYLLIVAGTAMCRGFCTHRQRTPTPWLILASTPRTPAILTGVLSAPLNITTAARYAYGSLRELTPQVVAFELFNTPISGPFQTVHRQYNISRSFNLMINRLLSRHDDWPVLSFLPGPLRAPFLSPHRHRAERIDRLDSFLPPRCWEMSRKPARESPCGTKL